MNIELVRKIADQLNKVVGEGPDGDYKNLITFVTDRPGHDLRYAIDPIKIEKELGWRKEHDFDANLEETVRWYVQKYR
jgi:dTDP-glucose 4,6-dehydratase